MYFVDWLTSPLQMNGRFGDLPRDAARDTGFPRKDTVSLSRLLEHIGSYGPARRVLRHAWLTFRAETTADIDDTAGILILNDAELAVVADSLETYLRLDRDEDGDLESETDETVKAVLQKIRQA